MPKKYHVNVQNTPLDFGYIYKFRIVRGENCINCGKCTKVCIYEAHRRRAEDPRIDGGSEDRGMQELLPLHPGVSPGSPGEIA
jgi:ferredoxin